MPGPLSAPVYPIYNAPESNPVHAHFVPVLLVGGASPADSADRGFCVGGAQVVLLGGAQVVYQPQLWNRCGLATFLGRFGGANGTVTPSRR